MLIYHHLGLGDHIICNAIVWKMMSLYNRVELICKKHNASTVQDMYPLSLITVNVEDDEQAAAMVGLWNGPKLLMGGWAGNFNPSTFDQSFYEQAGIPFDERWNGFRLPSLIDEAYVPVPATAFVFMHHDPKRGMAIDITKVRTDDASLIVEPDGVTSMIRYVRLLCAAKEIHCINSSWAILIDSIPGLAAIPKYLHLYARPGSGMPTFRNNWHFL